MSISHPLFRVNDLGDSDWRVAVTPREAEELASLATYVTADPDRDPESFCRDARRASRRLPNRLAETLQDFVRWGSRRGCLLLSVPLGRFPEPCQQSQPPLLIRAQAVLNEFIGHTVMYQMPTAGQLFHPLPCGPASRARTEMTSHRLRPDFVTLTCLRGSSSIRLHLLGVADLVSALESREAAALREPRWFLATGSGLAETFAERGVAEPVPILSGAQDDPTVVLDPDFMRGIDEDADRLLARVISVCPEVGVRVTAASGDILIVDNTRGLLGTSCVPASLDRFTRVVRSFVVASLGASRHVRPGNGRVITAPKE